MGAHFCGSGLSPAPRLPTGLLMGPTGRPGPGGSCGDRSSLGIGQCAAVGVSRPGGDRAEPADAEDAGPPPSSRASASGVATAAAAAGHLPEPDEGQRLRPTHATRAFTTPAQSVESPESKLARARLGPRGHGPDGTSEPVVPAAPACPRNPWPGLSCRSRSERASGTLCAPSRDGWMECSNRGKAERVSSRRFWKPCCRHG